MNLEDDMKEEADTADAPVAEEEQAMEEVQDDFKLPENQGQAISSTKEKLRGFLEPLPKEIMTRISTMEAACANDLPDFAQIARDLPFLIKDIRNFVAGKKDMRQFVERELVDMLVSYEKKTEKSDNDKKSSEKRLVECLKELREMRTRNELMQKELVLAYKDVNVEWKAIAKAAAWDKRTGTLEKIAEQSSTEDQTTEAAIEQPLEEPTEYVDIELPAIEKVFNCIKEACVLNESIKQVDISKRTGIAKSNLSKLVNRLVTEKRIKRTAKGILKFP